MLFKSAIITIASGSLGGITASHNRGGNYLRARVIPTDPNTDPQTFIRQIFGDLANVWVNLLTQAQRQAWQTYATNVPLTGPLGDAITVSGINMYIRSNTPRVQAGLPRVDDGPTVFDLGEFSFGLMAGDATADTTPLTFNNGDAWANEDDSALLLYTSRQQNESINFFRGPYQFAATVLGDSITPPTSPAASPYKFGDLVAGNRVFGRLNVTRVDGRLSQTQHLVALAV